MTRRKISRKQDVADEYIAGLYIHHLPVPPQGRIIPDPCEEAARNRLTENEYELLAAEDVGTALNVWFPSPATLCVVWNIKRVKEIWDFAMSNAQNMPNEINLAWRKVSKRGEYFFSFLSLPWAVRKFYAEDILKRWNMKFVGKDFIDSFYAVNNWVYQAKKTWELSSLNQKPNKLGLPAGKMTCWEEYYAGYSAPLRSGAREFLEEAQRHPTKLAFSHKVPDRKPGTYKWFFWIIETHEEWNPDPESTGVKGETLPPRVIPITELPETFFYYTHAQGVIALLEQLVRAGLGEYKASLEIMKEKFKPDPRFNQRNKRNDGFQKKVQYDERKSFEALMVEQGVTKI